MGRGKDTEREEAVEDQSTIGDETWDEAVGEAHIDHQQDCLLYTSQRSDHTSRAHHRIASRHGDPLRSHLKEVVGPVSYTHLDVYKRQP